MPLGLYIHIPWCPTRCIYCDFNTYVSDNDDLKQQYQAALIRELTETATALDHPVIDTIFFGGGTPTTLSPNQLLEIVETVKQNFTLSPHAEITTEANPGTLSLAYLQALQEGGLNRLSLGVQSFRNEELTFLSRLHDVTAVQQTVALARQAGFDNLSLDLIFNLPYQTIDQWAYTLQQAINLNPDHLSIYALIVEPGTPLHHQATQGHLPLPDGDLAADMYALTIETLASVGYAHYEISNWAKLDMEDKTAKLNDLNPTWQTPALASAHNLIYWRNQSYLGCGAGAFGTVHGKRWANVKRPQTYNNLVATNAGLGLAREVHTIETIDQTTAMAEHMLLGLRLVREGVSNHEFRQRFGYSLMDLFYHAINDSIEQGLLEWQDNQPNSRLRLTYQGRFLANQVMINFMDGIDK